MKKILIVEDSENVARMLELMLHGYEVKHARNGEEAIELYENSIDLALMDIVMPDMNGIDAIKGIKQIDQNAKILVVSAVDSPNVISEATEAGAIDYLVKPFSAKKLRNKVEEVLSK